MSADVFELLPVIPAIEPHRADSAVRIRALGVFGADRVFCGTSDGRVLLFMPPVAHSTAAPAEGEEGGKFELCKECSLGRKKDVLQLEVFGDLNRVLVRTDGGYIDLLHMVTLEIQASQGLLNKGVALFVAEKGTPLYRIAVLSKASARTKRAKLILYEFTSSAAGFEQVREPIELPDGVFCAEFFRGILCLGFFGKNRKEYRLLNVDTLVETELFPLDTCKAPPHIKVVGDELLLVRDELGLFIDAAGQIVTSHNNIVWSGAPSVVGFKDPYVVSLQEKNKCFEVHNILTQQLIQTIPFPMKNMRFIVGTEAFPFVLLASNTAVFCANKKSTSRQIADLISLKKTQDAVLLAEYALQHVKQSHESGVNAPEHALNQLLATLGASADVLFSELDFPGAFACWTKCLPRIAGPSAVGESETILDLALRRKPSSERRFVDVRLILARFPDVPQPVGSPLTVSNRPVPIADTVRRKLRLAAGASGDIIEKHQVAAKRHLLSFLKTFAERAFACQKSCATSAPTDLLDTPLLCDVHTALVFLYAEEREAAVDVAISNISHILRASLEKTADASVLPQLLFHVGMVENILRARRFDSLVGLLLTRQDQIGDALTLWHELCEQQDTPPHVRQNAIDEAAGILRQLLLTPQSHSNVYTRTQLLWEHAVWVLETTGPAGVSDIFCVRPSRTGDYKQHVELGIPARAVSEFLAGKFGDTFQRPFLEYQVSQLRCTDSDFHTRLAKMLVDASLQEIARESYTLNKRIDAESMASAATSVDLHILATPTRKQLHDLLQESEFYSRPELQHVLTGTPLIPELVVVLSKQSEHRAALELLVRKLRDFPAAEAYCTQHKHEDPGLTLALLRVYLVPNETSQDIERPRLSSFSRDGTVASGSAIPSRALRLLQTHARELAPHDVLPLLPAEMPLEELDEYLRRSITHSHSQAHLAQITSSLLRTDDINLRAQLAVLQNRRLVVDDDTMCPVCQKRIGSTVFARFPNGTLVHFRCQGPNPSVDPVTGADFSRWRTQQQYFDS